MTNVITDTWRKEDMAGRIPRWTSRFLAPVYRQLHPVIQSNTNLDTAVKGFFRCIKAPDQLTVTYELA